jgi:hypothetical protein
MNVRYFGKPQATTIGTDWTTVDEVLKELGGKATIEFSNEGATTTSGFRVQVKPHPGADWHTLLADANFDSTSLSVLLAGSTTGPQELTGGAKAFFMLNIAPCFGLRFQAKVASGTTTGKIAGAIEDGGF